MNELQGMMSGLLSNPEEMKKMVELAGAVMENMGMGSGSGATGPPREVKAAPREKDRSEDQASVLSRIGKKLLNSGGTVSSGADKRAFYETLMPLLSPKRRQKLDRASQLSRLLAGGLTVMGKRGNGG